MYGVLRTNESHKVLFLAFPKTMNIFRVIFYLLPVYMTLIDITSHQELFRNLFFCYIKGT